MLRNSSSEITWNGKNLILKNIARKSGILCRTKKKKYESDRCEFKATCVLLSLMPR